MPCEPVIIDLNFLDFNAFLVMENLSVRKYAGGCWRMYVANNSGEILIVRPTLGT